MKAAFYKGTRPGWQGLYSRAARFIDRGPYSHCELIFSDGMSASASYIDGGVRLKRIDYDAEHWDIVDLAGFDEPAARAWFEERAGEGYDLWGNLRFIFGWVRDDDGRWFCSEALMAALGFHGPWRFGPNGAAAAIKRWCSDITNQPAQAGFFMPDGDAQAEICRKETP